MIELKDIIKVYYNDIHSDIVESMLAEVGKFPITRHYAVEVNREKLDEWIKQAIEIETFTPEQLEEYKIRHYFLERGTVLEKYIKRIEELEKQLKEIKDICSK